MLYLRDPWSFQAKDAIAGLWKDAVWVTDEEASGFAASQPEQWLGRRICIYGSGHKTTLSSALGILTALPVIELDAIFWLPGWVARDRDEMLNMVLDRVSSGDEGWIVDGNYSIIIPHLLPLADTVFGLNLPHLAMTLKTVKRIAFALRNIEHCARVYELRSYRQLNEAYRVIGFHLNHMSSMIAILRAELRLSRCRALVS